MKGFFLSTLLCMCGLGAWAQSQDYRILRDIRYHADSARHPHTVEQCRLDVYHPKQPGFMTVVWFHGGGLSGGRREIPSALMDKGIAVVGVGYRLHPQAVSPTYIEDAASAIAWVFRNIASYGGDSTRIFVAGYSAGAYLALMVGLDKSWLASNRLDANRIAGIVALSGQAITHFTIRRERGIAGTQPIVDQMAPLFHVRPDAPPILLITGDRELEMLGRYEENAYLMRMMKIAGHTNTRLLELGGYDHGMMDAGLPLLLGEVLRIGGKK